MKTELLPCPFCGSSVRIIERESSDNRWFTIFYDAGCTDDNCYLSEGADYHYASIEKLAEDWNRRK